MLLQSFLQILSQLGNLFSSQYWDPDQLVGLHSIKMRFTFIIIAPLLASLTSALPVEAPEGLSARAAQLTVGGVSDQSLLAQLDCITRC